VKRRLELLAQEVAELVPELIAVRAMVDGYAAEVDDLMMFIGGITGTTPILDLCLLISLMIESESTIKSDQAPEFAAKYGSPKEQNPIRLIVKGDEQ